MTNFQYLTIDDFIILEQIVIMLTLQLYSSLKIFIDGIQKKIFTNGVLDYQIASSQYHELYTFSNAKNELNSFLWC